jgi:deoxyribonuclease V
MRNYDTDISPQQAIQIQAELKPKSVIADLETKVQTVAGADISFDRGSDMMHAAIIVMTMDGHEPVARSLISYKTNFPYIPGLLAFREMPVLLKSWKQLQIKPDVLILDGHGLAHPRRMGIATHLGIEINHPTIGCAKNILTGSHRELGIEKGSTADLIDEGNRLGFALRSRTNVNPIYISPGHKCSFEDCYEIIMQILTNYKLPRTTRLAHKWANKLRKGEVEAGYYEF